MKTLVSLLASLLASLLMTAPIMAVEYVKLTNASPTYTSDPNDVIEIVTARVTYGQSGLRTIQVDGVDLALTPSSVPKSSSYSDPQGCEGTILSGVTNWSASMTEPFIVVLRVTKPNEGFKSEPVVVPVAQGTSYNVELETSTDLQTWVPVAPGNYTSTGTPRFFRVKAAVTP